ncbi:COR domain-containing protein [Streptomyces sp. 7R007]
MSISDPDAASHRVAQPTRSGVRLLISGRTTFEHLLGSYQPGQITELELADYSDPELPVWLTRLPRLGSLTVRYTGAEPIRSLPAPQALHTLTLQGVNVTALPRFGTWVTTLRRLHLVGTGITAFGNNITALASLEELTLDAPLLTSVTWEIGFLSNLRSLRISSQRLTTLPSELGRLPNSLDLFLDCPNLADPFPALLARGVSDLLTYLRSLESDAQEQYEAKVVLVGEGNVGKSCLVSALRGEEFVEGRPTTHGIEVSTIDLPHPEAGDTLLRLNLWDFGGQEVYRIGHQFFYSRRSLYVLVWRPREGQEENAVEGWIRRIRLRVGNDARILIVSTYRDTDGRHPELDYPELRRRFGEILVGNLAVDNRSGHGVEELRRAIAAQAAQLPQMGQLISHAWLAVREQLYQLAASTPYIPRTEYDDVCRDQGLDGAETDTLATLLHDLGHIIHFGQEHGLSDVMVLQPEWLTKAIGYVLEDGVTRTNGGILDYARLPDLWGGGAGRTRYPRQVYPYFLRLMEMFDFSYRLDDQGAALVAQVVPHDRPALPWDADRRPGPEEHEASLLCTFTEPPVGLMAWLTVRNHRYWTGPSGVHWRRGAFLTCADYGATALVELSSDLELRLTVRGPAPNMFFALLRDSVQHLVKERWSGLGHAFHIPCPHRSRSGTPCPGRFPVEALERFSARGKTTIDCYECAETQDIVTLLTGFSPVPGTATALRELGQKIDSLERDSRARAEEIISGQGELRRELERGLSEAAYQLRAVKKLLSREQQDCPSLFTLVPLRSWNPLASHYRLTLWCEETSRSHPWDPASYDLRLPKALVREALPYFRLIIPLLEFAVPLTGRLAAEVFREVDQKAAQELLATTREVLSRFEASDDAAAALAQPEGPGGDEPRRGYRTVRYLLREADGERFPPFGGMEWRTNSAGDRLWLCPGHLRSYDPGLPVLGTS